MSEEIQENYVVIYKDKNKKFVRYKVYNSLKKATDAASKGNKVDKVGGHYSTHDLKQAMKQYPTKIREGKEEAQMKTYEQLMAELSEGKAANAAQQAAIAIAKKEKGDYKEGNAFTKALNAAREKGDDTFVVAGKKYKCEDYDDDGNVKEAKMDPAAMAKAMAAFKKKGGKIKKLAPGKAAGYHGKEDPGSGVQGMMDRGDTKGFNRKKKVKSMK